VHVALFSKEMMTRHHRRCWTHIATSTYFAVSAIAITSAIAVAMVTKQQVLVRLRSIDRCFDIVAVHRVGGRRGVQAASEQCRVRSFSEAARAVDSEFAVNGRQIVGGARNSERVAVLYRLGAQRYRQTLTQHNLQRTQELLIEYTVEHEVE